MAQQSLLKECKLVFVFEKDHIINHVNWIKMKHCMIISANAEKHFGKTQQTLKIKNVSIVGIEENFLNLIKAATKIYS